MLQLLQRAALVQVFNYLHICIYINVTYFILYICTYTISYIYMHYILYIKHIYIFHLESVSVEERKRVLVIAASCTRSVLGSAFFVG